MGPEQMGVVISTSDDSKAGTVWNSFRETQEHKREKLINRTISKLKTLALPKFPEEDNNTSYRLEESNCISVQTLWIVPMSVSSCCIVV